MSKQFNTYRVGIESMTETQLGWWEKKGVTYKPILEYNPLSKDGVAGFSGCVWCAGVCVCWCAGVCFVRVFYWVCYAVSVFVCFSCVVSCAVSFVLMDFRLPS